MRENVSLHRQLAKLIRVFRARAVLGTLSVSGGPPVLVPRTPVAGGQRFSPLGLSRHFLRSCPAGGGCPQAGTSVQPRPTAARLSYPLRPSGRSVNKLVSPRSLKYRLPAIRPADLDRPEAWAAVIRPGASHHTVAVATAV